LVAWSIDGRIILNEILNKYCASAWNGFNWLRIGLVGEKYHYFNGTSG